MSFSLYIQILFILRSYRVSIFLSVFNCVTLSVYIDPKYLLYIDKCYIISVYFESN